MDGLQKRVLAQLAMDFFPPTSQTKLSKALGLAEEKIGLALDKLTELGILILSNNNYHFNPEADTVAGIYQSHVKGFGFIHSGNGRVFYVGPAVTRGAIDGDVVMGEVVARNPGKAPFVRITEFLARRPRLIVGQYQQATGLGSVQAGSKKIMIPPKFANNAKDGDCVLVTHNKWEGRVVAKLPRGDRGRLDLLAIAAKRGVALTFPTEVEEASAKLPDSPTSADLAGRKDFRHLEVVTIDGDGAGDLDDGLSLSKNTQGNWELGIHIADVAHYVQPGSVLDKDALRRSQSFYLIDREIPMLPEKVCENLCSLLPGVDRLAISCIVEVNETGQVVDYNFVESVIRSRAQLTYSQVDSNQVGQWTPLVEQAGDLAKLLKENRVKRGAAHIHLPSIKVVLDDDGIPVDMEIRGQEHSRSIIEEFMLLLNSLVAKFLSEKGISFLARSNGGFNPERIHEINTFLSRWGYQLPLEPTVKDLQSLLKEVEGSPQELPVCRKLARYLQKSRYTLDSGGHFNLAMDYYCHASAPIRRYGDLYNQHQIKSAINSTQGKPGEELPQVAEHCSFRERLAQDVEGECLELKKLQYMESQGEKDWKAIVLDTVAMGPLVALPNTVEGIVVTGASKDVLDNLKPGEIITVRVHKIDIRLRQVYFSLNGE